MISDLTRLGLAFACLLAYVFLCLLIYLPRWRKRSARRTAQQQTPCLIAYASQTGNAEALAQHSAACLALAGIEQQVLPLAQVQASHLQQAERILFIVSTYGEGDAPDNAAQFADQILASSLHLPHLHYAVLALGAAS